MKRTTGSMEPEVWTTIEPAEASTIPYDNDGLYIPLVNEDDQRYLAAVLNIDPSGYNNGWVERQPAESTVLSVTYDDYRKSSNPPIVKQ